LLSKYLQTREELAGLVIIMDARHPLTELDESMLDWVRADRASRCISC